MSEELLVASKDIEPFSVVIGLGFRRLEKGYSQGILEVTDRLLNFNGHLHGGVIYSMADTGMGGALFSCLEKDERCTTIEIKIVYLHAVTSGTLTCETKLTHRSKRIAVLESEIQNEGRLIAKAIGTFYVFKARGD